MGGSMGVISDVILGGAHSILREIGKTLGIYSHDETITDLQISNLLTPGEAEKSARRTAKHASGGNAMIYFKGYRKFQNDYRRKYSAQFMARQGYAPSTTANSKVIIEGKLKTYLETTYNYAEITLDEFGDKYLTLEEKGRHAVQQIAGYDFATGQIVIAAKKYSNHQYLQLTDSTQLQVTSTRLYDETIIQNLTDNYGYDGIYIYIGDNKYSVGPIVDMINADDKYETVCTHVPHQYANIAASALINGVDTATISYPDDTDLNGYVEDYEIIGGIVNILVTLPATAVVGDTLTVTIDDVITNYTVTADMISNGLLIAYSDYSLANMPILPNEIILTPVERIVNIVTEAAYGTEASYASYRVLSGEVGTETRYWVGIAETLDIYEYLAIDSTAIIPMKEDNVMADTDAYKLKRMLRKLNLSGDQLKASIENPDMDSAYLMLGINPQYNDPIINEVMFKIFDYLSPGSGNVSLSLNKLSMKYRFSMLKKTVAGSIGEVGSYTRTQTSSDDFVGAGVVLTLRYQGNENEYKELTITNFEQNYVVSGHDFTAYLDSTGGMCRIFIPLDLLNSLPYKKFVWVYERSLCMLAYSMEVVRVKWYETSAFGSLLKIVGAVLTVWTMGAASGIYAMVVALAKVVIVGLVVSYIAQQIGGVTGAILGAIAGMLIAGGFTFDISSLMSTEVWLKFANEFINTLSQMQQHELDSYVSKSQDEISELSKQVEDLQSKIEPDEGTSLIMRFDSAYAGRINTLYQTTESYCSGLIDASVDYITDYSRQIEYAITTRSQVVSGIG